MQSPVYVIFIDAFDRLCHIELFNISSERNMCPLVRRLLFNLYGNQKFQILWNNCLSTMYKMTNGVRQCAVGTSYQLLPSLPSYYVEKFTNLKTQLKSMNMVDIHIHIHIIINI